MELNELLFLGACSLLSGAIADIRFPDIRLDRLPDTHIKEALRLSEKIWLETVASQEAK